MVLGGLPLVVPGARGTQDDLQAGIAEKVRMVNQNNVSFFNLAGGVRSVVKYRNVPYRDQGGVWARRGDPPAC